MTGYWILVSFTIIGFLLGVAGLAVSFYTLAARGSLASFCVGLLLHASGWILAIIGALLVY